MKRPTESAPGDVAPGPAHETSYAIPIQSEYQAIYI